MKRPIHILAVGLVALLVGIGTTSPAVAVVGERLLVREPSPGSGVTRNIGTIRSEIRGMADERFVKDEVLVKFRGEQAPRRISLRGENVGRALERFRGQSDVEYAEPNYIAHALFVPNDSFYQPYQWHLDNPTYGGIGAEEAWDVARGAGTIVAVVDTGVAYENYLFFEQAPDLAGTSFVPGYDFVSGDSHANDDEGHGTHVAGTIAQTTNNSQGVAGIAHEASIMPVKVLNSGGSGTYADIADGIRFAADNGADVINLSLGGSSPSATLESALAYAYGKGVTIVAAAGNNGTNTLSYPAAYNDYVIAVGATRFDEALAPYSSYGPGLDIVAPGGDTSVDQNGDGYGDGVLQQTFGGSYWNPQWGYYFYQGTSMAAPHVAGTAALLITNGTATTPEEVRAALQESARDLGAPGWDTTYGWGLINASAALGWSGATGTPPPPADNPPTVSITEPAPGATASGTVTLAASASDDNGVDRVEFFVDGSLTGSDTTAPHAVSWDSTGVPDGPHSVSAVAFDTAGQTASDTISVTVENNVAPPPPENAPPVADAGPDQAGEINETITFDGSGSTDDGAIASYEWDFGDGASATGTAVSHAYQNAGVYIVTLTVTDDGGLEDSDTAEVTVTEPVPPPPPPGEVEVFADSFENGEWNGLWSEDSQGEWRDSGRRSTDGEESAEVDGDSRDASLTSIVIDLGGGASARVTFDWYIERSLDSGEYLAFDISTDGGSSWTELARLRGNQDQEDVWHSESFTASGIDTIRLRFRGTMSRGSEDANVDNVVVTAW